MKKYLKAMLVGILALSVFGGCSNTDNNTGIGDSKSTPNATVQSDLKIGMVTDLGSIDDKSFNQLTWEGIQIADKTYGTTSKYLKPTSADQGDLMKEVTNLYDAGFRFIVTPGFKFATVIYEAQDKYPDADFLILDSTVYSASNEEKINDNTVCALFKEQEAGFLAGVATAVQIKEGNTGFIGGMQTEPVQRFNWGYQQGINYANDNYGTKIVMNAEDFIYQGTFSDAAAGQQISAQLYDRGVKVIFCAAGGVGSGVIKEARERGAKGQDVWVVGVDADQYNEGIYTEGKSIILTSALKKVGNATLDVIAKQINNQFPGGQILEYGISNDGVGLPEQNPNLGDEAISKVNEVYELIKTGQLVVSSTNEGLIK